MVRFIKITSVFLILLCSNSVFAAERLTDRTVLAEAPASNDITYMVDVSDTTDNPAGTSKQITWTQVGEFFKSLFYTKTETDTLLEPIKYENGGVVTTPTLTDNGDGTIDLAADGLFNFYKDSTGTTGITQLSVVTPLDDYVLTDNITSFVYADYNSGTPVYGVTTNAMGFLTNADWTAVYRVNKSGTELHKTDYDAYGIALSSKLLYKDIILNGFQRLSGLVLSTSGTRVSTVSSGSAYFGVQTYPLAENISGTSGQLFEFYQTGGVWSEVEVSSYDSAYYTDGTDRLLLGNNKVTGKWFYRGVEEDNHTYYTHGGQYNSIAEVLEEARPAPPSEVSSHSVYVGMIVIQKGAVVGVAYPRKWDTVDHASVTNHDDLANINQATTGVTNGHINDQAQPIAGEKNFLVSPIVPTPTTDSQASTKKYVDDNSGGITDGNTTGDITQWDGDSWEPNLVTGLTIGDLLQVVGVCTDAQYTDQPSCETATETWGPGLRLEDLLLVLHESNTIDSELADLATFESNFFTIPTGTFGFDTFPIYEDSAHVSGIARNATTLAIHNGTIWMTSSLTDSLDPAPTSGTLTITPASFDPADGAEGDSTSSQTLTITAVGGPVTLTSFALGGSNYFTDATTGTCTGTDVLAAGEDCTVDIDFDYTLAGGPYSDTFTVNSDATGGPNTVNLGPVAVSAATVSLAFVESVSNATGSTFEPIVIPALSIVSDDDIIIACLESDANGVWDTVPVGFVELEPGGVVNGSLNVSCFTKIASSESGTYTFGNTGNYLTGVITVFSKSAGTWASPVDHSTVSSTQTAIATSSVTLVDGDIFMAFTGFDDANTIATLDGLTSVYNAANGSAGAFCGYQTGLSGAVVKNLVTSGVGESVTFSLVVHAE